MTVYVLVCFAPRDAVPPADCVALPAGDIAAIVRPRPGDEFIGPAAEARLADAATVTALAVDHAACVESVATAADGAVLPVAFGSIFATPIAAAAVIDVNRDAIAAFLARAGGHREYSVKASVDARAAKQRHIDRAIAAAGLDPAMPPGQRFLREQSLRRAAAGRYSAALDTYCNDIAATLAPHATEIAPRNPLPRDDGRTTIASWSLCVPTGAGPALLKTLESLRTGLADAEIAIESSGPWPLWSFVPPLSRD